MAEESNSMNQDKQTPKWLRTIQLNSWEAELLISALVLYALFQIPDYIQHTALQVFERGSQATTFSNMLRKAVDLLKVGYVLHIIVRGIWVSTVGLSYVFPKGLQNENLNFKGKFKAEIEKSSSLVKNVLRLEELSSIIYGLSFIGFGSVIGVSTLLFSLIIFVELFSAENVVNGPILTIAVVFLFLIFILCCLLVFFDFLTSGLLRRRESTARWFYPIALVFRVLTLSFLYRRSILALQSNTVGWKKYLIPFFIFSFTFGFIVMSKEHRTSRLENYFKRTQNEAFQASNFEDKRGQKDILISTIQSSVIDGDLIQLFVSDLKLFEKIYNLDTIQEDTVPKKKWVQLTSGETTKYLNRWLTVEIDSSKLNNLKWWITQHPSSLKYGFASNVEIESLNKGDHILKIGLDTEELQLPARASIKNSDYNYQYWAYIPFYNSK